LQVNRKSVSTTNQSRPQPGGVLMATSTAALDHVGLVTELFNSPVEESVDKAESMSLSH
jgi:hypothetical protein